MIDLRETRKALGLTQAEMAALLDMHQTTFSRYETGEIALDKRMELAVKAIEAERGG